MKLLLQVPASHKAERLYAWSVLLGEMLGLTFDIEERELPETTISMPGTAGSLVVAEDFFSQPEELWLTGASMPSRPVPRLPLPSSLVRSNCPADVVALFGRDRSVRTACDLGPGHARINFDIAGSAFFMLSRYEEALPGRRDSHDRFPASESIAFQEGFLLRPVVNEYAQLLQSCLLHCWPQLTQWRRGYRVLLTHDVDSPLFHLGAPISREVTSVAGDLIKRKDVSLAAKRIGSAFAARRGNHDGDPNNTFDYLMSVSERHSLRSAFYFITGGDAPNDGGYSMQMPWIESLVRRIGAKGHEIGLHPSYHTYLDPGETAAQARTLRECAQRNGIQQESWGGRQHYLRWRAGTTWRNWEDAGMDYDSSMGFAEMIGFRSGCCHEHGTFNVLERAPMRLRERPLLLMETTLISYMQLDGSRRLEVASGLIAACRLYDGDMTLLWHNSKVVSKAERMEYEAVVDMAVSA
jgi:hypothetical protein